MNKIPRKSSPSRARRLQTEASNCIAIAIGKTGAFTADLIDEAVRLHARARSINQLHMPKDGKSHAQRECDTATAEAQ